jgi:hypothetical protein
MYRFPQKRDLCGWSLEKEPQKAQEAQKGSGQLPRVAKEPVEAICQVARDLRHPSTARLVADSARTSDVA